MNNDWRQDQFEYGRARRSDAARYDAQGASQQDVFDTNAARPQARHAAPEGYARYSARHSAPDAGRAPLRREASPSYDAPRARAPYQGAQGYAPARGGAHTYTYAPRYDNVPPRGRYEAQAQDFSDEATYREPSYRDAVRPPQRSDRGMYTPYAPQYDPYQQDQLARPSYAAPSFAAPAYSADAGMQRDAAGARYAPPRFEQASAQQDMQDMQNRQMRGPVAYGAYASRAPQQEAPFDAQQGAYRAREDARDMRVPPEDVMPEMPQNDMHDELSQRTTVMRPIRRVNDLTPRDASRPYRGQEPLMRPQAGAQDAAARVQMNAQEVENKQAQDARARLERMRRAGEEALRAQGYQEEDANAFMNTGMINLDAAIGSLNEDGVDPVLSAQQTARMAVIRQAQMDAPLQQPTQVQGVHSRPGYEGESDAGGKKKKSAWRSVIEWIVLLAVAVGAALLLRTFVISFYRVQGPSMQPTLFTGERVLVNKIGYRFGDIERFDIVVCHYPGSEEYYVKRVVALPGDTVRVERGVVYVNDEALEEKYVVNRDDTGMSELVVPADSYMVFGDNRVDSMDSRSIGAIARDAIVGRAIAVTWPIDKLQTIKRIGDDAQDAQQEDTQSVQSQTENKDAAKVEDAEPTPSQEPTPSSEPLENTGESVIATPPVMAP